MPSLEPAALVYAGLAQSWRSEHNVFYAIGAEGIRPIVDYLTLDCCGGQPELCGVREADATSRTTRKKRA